jgi:hypothetical protein
MTTPTFKEPAMALLAGEPIIVIRYLVETWGLASGAAIDIIPERRCLAVVGTNAAEEWRMVESRGRGKNFYKD